ncbi:MAG: hypothetical protein A3F11_08575 [Gammaproteobacteria bacterium RIFCSPHIGHO2_12_FULL_37_14]|nr:MAG: hypothetical protein A3F11_08575 [Gammaproteobacteria bacterium RIFCSPHIGHO2_12_FULL_37_14]
MQSSNTNTIHTPIESIIAHCKFFLLISSISKAATIKSRNSTDVATCADLDPKQKVVTSDGYP